MQNNKPIWFELNLATFGVRQEGCQEKTLGQKALYVTPGLEKLISATELADAEYGLAVEVDLLDRTVLFGRDYLGHYPLMYACTESHLYISDDAFQIKGVLENEGIELTLSEQSLALYFSMGYIPQGMTAYSQIKSCENTSLYRWKRGAITKISLFEPVEVNEAFSVTELGERIEHEVAKLAATSNAIDVWCSGGLDSSIMAHCFNEKGRKAELITLGYGHQIHELFGDGERRFAQQVARHCNVPIREIDFSCEKFSAIHELFIKTHNGPIIDTCAPPKYALAEVSRDLVITGEGSDNLFGGPKNNQMLYGQQRNPSASLGWLYALAHNRFAHRLHEIFKQGVTLTDYITDYLNNLLVFYPGDLIRKLFYLNMLMKAGSMIFQQSYYPGRIYNIKIRHPFAALGVYKAAFSLANDRKYKYPATKLALIELYGKRLPESIVRRKKSGTIIPLKYYLRNFSRQKFDFSTLANTNFFNEEFFQQMSKSNAYEKDALLVYALITLNLWINQKGEIDHVESLSAKTSHYERSPSAVFV